MPQIRSLGIASLPPRALVAVLLTALALIQLRAPAAHGQASPAKPRLQLQTTTDSELGRVSRGTYSVFENRAAQSGRMIELAVVILRARTETPKPDPVFVLGGGPGQDATSQATFMANDWMRSDRDIVLVSQRGTGGSMRLDCGVPGLDGDLQGLLE